MAGFAKLLSLTETSGADLSAKAFLFGKYSAGKVVTAGAGEETCGVIQENPPSAADRGVEVSKVGTSKLVVDGTTPIAYGDMLKSDASGRGVKASATNKIGAQSLGASSSPGDIIEVRILEPNSVMV